MLSIVLTRPSLHVSTTSYLTHIISQYLSIYHPDSARLLTDLPYLEQQHQAARQFGHTQALIEPTIWSQIIDAHTPSSTDVLLITDWANPRDLHYLRQQGHRVITIHVTSSLHLRQQRGLLPSLEPKDLRPPPCDFTIENNGTLEDLSLPLSHIIVKILQRHPPS
jgi:hypothetical protein